MHSVGCGLMTFNTSHFFDTYLAKSCIYDHFMQIYSTKKSEHVIFCLFDVNFKFK